MNSSLPEGFLKRIRPYPEPVRAQLSGPLSDEGFTQTLRVLHGDEVDVSKKPKDHETMRFDVFLSRMMTSKKFEMRADSLLAFLSGNAAANKAGFDWESGLAFLGALSDPTKVYLYKLREMERAHQADPALLARLRRLMSVIGVFQIFADRPQQGWEIDAVVADMICKAAGNGSTELLNVMLCAVGLEQSLIAEVHAKHEKALGVLPQGGQAATGLAQHLIAEAGLGAHLSLAGAHALKVLETLVSKQNSAMVLAARRSLHVVLVGPVKGADGDYWKGQAEEGWIAAWSERTEESAEAILNDLEAEPSTFDDTAGCVLVLPAHLRLPPLALSLMQCLVLPPLVSVQIERQGNSGSWAAEISGFDDKQSTIEDIGYLWRPNGARGPHVAKTPIPALPFMHVGSDLGDSAMPLAAVSRESAFALLLRLPGAPPVSTYVNSECCLAFEEVTSLAALTSAGEDGGESRRKPVVILGPNTPLDPRYIIDSVQRFWAFSGRYIIGFADPGYDSIAGNFTPRQTADRDAELCRVLITDLATLPLGLFASAGSKLTDQIVGPQALGYIISPDAFAVRVAHGGLISAALQQKLPRVIDRSKLKSADREALALAGQITAEYVEQHEPGRHWPLDRLFSLHLRTRDVLSLACRDFVNQPSAAAAHQVLNPLMTEPELVVTLSVELGEFARALASRVDLLLALEGAERQYFLRILRSLDVADDVAWQLACHSREICDAAPRDIVALFEFLSCCLSSEQVSQVLAATALGSIAKSRRIPYRLAECLRRYGTPLISIMYLKKLQQEASPCLEDPSFLQSFSPLLRSGPHNTATDILGEAIVRDIAASGSFSLRFQEALASGDRQSALGAMAETGALDTGEIIKWLDQMRSYSAVLKAMQLPLSAIFSPALKRVFVRKKAAVIFSDMAVLGELRSAGILDPRQDVDAVGMSYLGDPEGLDAIIREQSELGSVGPFELRGETAREVFAHATEMTALRTAKGETAPLVSVIVSAYNPDIELMRLSLSSITRQSHRSMEIFVVDDASDAPHSAAIEALCAEFDGVQYSRMACNSGPYAGRNWALSRAKGEYFAIQDADDWSHPERFARQIAALEADPLLQMVTTPHIRIDHNGRVQLEAGFQVLGDGPMTSMFRSATLIAFGGFARTRSRGDVEMRERIRAYYGTHALTELVAPIALCLGDRQTLSQRVIDSSNHHLRAFRQHIDSQSLLRHARRDFGARESLYRPLVPHALRVPELEERS